MCGHPGVGRSGGDQCDRLSRLRRLDFSSLFGIGVGRVDAVSRGAARQPAA